MNQNIIEAKRVLEECEAILIHAGAGMGIDSGLPDFRGNQGFWKAYPPIAKLGISFAEMANPYWFVNKPQLAWAFYGHRLNLYRTTEPHRGFDILLEKGKSLAGGYFVYTSNVDGQFQKAGFDPDFVKECHGSIHYLQCTIPCCNDIWTAKDIDIEVDMELFEAKKPLPKCSHCGALARPNILMFGDWNWIADRANKQASNFENWLNENRTHKRKIVIIELGAGTSVPTVRHRSEQICRNFGATLIRINPREYNVPAGNISIPTGALQGLDSIFG